MMSRTTIQRPYLPGWLAQWLERVIPVEDRTAGRALYAAMIVGLGVAGYDLTPLGSHIDELAEQALPYPIKQALQALIHLGDTSPSAPVLEAGVPLSPVLAKLLNDLVATVAPGQTQTGVVHRTGVLQDAITHSTNAGSTHGRSRRRSQARGVRMPSSIAVGAVGTDTAVNPDHQADGAALGNEPEDEEDLAGAGFAV